MCVCSKKGADPGVIMSNWLLLGIQREREKRLVLKGGTDMLLSLCECV